MLRKEDYPRFVPTFERYVHDHDRVRVLFDMDDFHGWDLGGLWQDVKFDRENLNHIERLAMVGEQRWQKWMATFCKPFTTARIRYFDHSDKDKAVEWLEQGGPDDPEATQKLKPLPMQKAKSTVRQIPVQGPADETPKKDPAPGMPKPNVQTPVMGV